MPIDEGTRLGRYEIRSKIGEGGMGEVYLAQDTQLDRKVAFLVIDKAQNFAWMPENRALVYFAINDLQLYLFDLATRTSRRLTNEPKITQIIATSPDSKWVIYQSLMAGNIDLRAISSDGGEPRTVVATPHQDYHPFVSPSGRWLYFLLDHKNVYRVPGPAQNWRSAQPEKVTDFLEACLLKTHRSLAMDKSYSTHTVGSPAISGS